ncbi:Transcriptional regulator, contains XRE-family HTH domain [Acetoanaerobium noterae]|uniref:Transcriptional regulator, contains XRE-family HTH domain n=1 Tax=Acetoanaerobium noterae TaxID=745369 RepID=A0A1T5A1X2_9FIRM|nr:helix-turn-helix transcriptional regulator [Acetoanaerobium noterae]SKB28633.1 Transcriptional regulator, contains XRE-family HTH domain [Acetoanaerobium noterae]
MNKFGNIFKALREEKGLTQQELVDLFNKQYHYKFGKSAISQYENNKRIPEVEVLQKWAEFFQVGLDFLLGNSDIKNPYKEAPEKTDEDIDLWLSKTDGYKELPEEDRELISNLAKNLLEKHRKEK